MNELYIVAFKSANYAMRADKLIKENQIKASTLPTPREISSSCGISIKFDKNEIEKIKEILEQNEVLYNGMYKVNKLENGTKELTKLY